MANADGGKLGIRGTVNPEMNLSIDPRPHIDRAHYSCSSVQLSSYVSGSDDPGRYPLSHHPVITRDDPPGSLDFGVMTGWVTQVGQVMRTVLYAEI